MRPRGARACRGSGARSRGGSWVRGRASRGPGADGRVRRMGFDQYHEPPEELSQETRTLARMFASLTEEAEAINWYEQRLAIEQDPDARKIIEDARHEEYKHFAMDFEFLLRK